MENTGVIPVRDLRLVEANGFLFPVGHSADVDRDVGVAFVRGVEAAAVEADAHPRRQMESEPERGRTAPLRGASGRSRGPHTCMS